MASPTSIADRHPCGSLRTHVPHEWPGQTIDETLACPGQPPVKEFGVRTHDEPLWPYRPWVD